MTTNDRLALELGRALLRAVTAEALLAEARAKVAAADAEAAEKPTPKKKARTQIA